VIIVGNKRTLINGKDVGVPQAETSACVKALPTSISLSV
jgi:hypothetical protein